MRGKEGAQSQGGRKLRITPAYAGKSSARSQFRMNPKDHPRVCGEKREILKSGGVKKGSPPRMRGKDICTMDDEDGVRITPAYAGKRDGSDLEKPEA